MIIQSISHDFDKYESEYSISIKNHLGFVIDETYSFYIEWFLFEYTVGQMFTVFFKETYIGTKIFLRDDI